MEVTSEHTKLSPTATRFLDEADRFSFQICRLLREGEKRGRKQILG